MPGGLWPAEALGRRIVIWGATGSGKTTLANQLGERLGLRVVDLDAIRHRNGWDSTPYDEFRRELEQTLDESAQGWVTAGSYSAISDVYLSRCDTLLWLNLPWRVSFWRLLRRSISRALTQEPLYEGSSARESWSLLLASRNSILLWSITNYRSHVRRTRQRLAQMAASVRVHELRSTQELDALLQEASGASSAAGSLLPPD